MVIYTSMEIPFVLHCFRPSETIEAVLRLRGRHNLTKEELRYLMVQFEKLNGKIIPRPGMTFKIPLPPPLAETEGGDPD